jgi:hypothetical protein
LSGMLSWLKKIGKQHLNMGKSPGDRYGSGGCQGMGGKKIDPDKGRILFTGRFGSFPVVCSIQSRNSGRPRVGYLEDLGNLVAVVLLDK